MGVEVSKGDKKLDESIFFKKDHISISNVDEKCRREAMA